MAETQVQKDLRGTIELIEQYGFRRGDHAGGKDMGYYSLQGAVNASVLNTKSIFSTVGRMDNARVALEISIKRQGSPYKDLSRWQMSYGRTQDEVIDLLNFAIDLYSCETNA